MEYKNYIFDLYGTLIDLNADEQAPRTWKRWIKWLDENKIKHPEYFNIRKDFFEKDMAARKKALEMGPYKHPEIDVIPIYKELFYEYGNRDMSDETIFQASYAFRKASIEHIRLFPGVIDFLAELRRKGKRAYILSNAQASYTEPEIKNFSLDKMVEGYLMSSDHKCMKPEKAFFDMILDRYMLNKEETVMIGDSLESDVRGAETAGISFIHLTGTNKAHEFYVNRIREI